MQTPKLNYPPNVNDKKYHLGLLCLRNHEYENTGKSLRYSKNSTCFICHNQTNNPKLVLINDSITPPNPPNNINYFVGRLCCNGHKYLNSNYSLRYKSNNRCVECSKIMLNKLKIHNKEYQTNNRKRINIKKAEWNNKNPEKIKLYRERNTRVCGDKNRASKREEWHRTKINPQVKLARYMGNHIRFALKKNKSNSWIKLVGYTASELKKHLEKQFDKNMNWDNYGIYWHIDHVIPKSLFHYTTPEQLSFRECWGLKNLRPLEKIKNLEKYTKLIKPFQTILNI